MHSVPHAVEAALNAVERADALGEIWLPCTRDDRSEGSSLIEHANALFWPARQEPGTARAIIMDPPYAVGSPVRDLACPPIPSALTGMKDFWHDLRSRR